MIGSSTLVYRFRHPNLVTLIGYSSTQQKSKCLIYELLPNGTLEDALEIGVSTLHGWYCLPLVHCNLTSLARECWWRFPREEVKWRHPSTVDVPTLHCH